VRDELDIGLARLGDRDRLREVLARFADLEPRLHKRAIAAARDRLDDGLAAAVRGLAEDRRLDGMVREALVDLLAPRAAAEAAWLRAQYDSDDEYEVRLAALRGLLRTPQGEAMVRDLAGELGRRSLREGDEDLLHEVLGAAPLPLPAAIAELGFRALLVAPLGNPVAEAERTLSEVGAAGDYPLVLPLCDLLRRGPDPVHAAALASVAPEAAASRFAHALSRRRLGHLLAHLALADDPLALGGEHVARLVVAAPDVDAAWLGPAHLLLGRRAEADGAWTAAAEAYRRAAIHFVRHPLPGILRRRFLADPDPARGSLPLAGLAARPELLLARQAHATGDGAAARAHLARAARLGDGDDETVAAIAALRTEVDR
jgi:hypothetical protein